MSEMITCRNCKQQFPKEESKKCGLCDNYLCKECAPMMIPMKHVRPDGGFDTQLCCLDCVKKYREQGWTIVDLNKFYNTQG